MIWLPECFLLGPRRQLCQRGRRRTRLHLIIQRLSRRCRCRSPAQCLPQIPPLFLQLSESRLNQIICRHRAALPRSMGVSTNSFPPRHFLLHQHIQIRIHPCLLPLLPIRTIGSFQVILYIQRPVRRLPPPQQSWPPLHYHQSSRMSLITCRRFRIQLPTQPRLHHSRGR